MKIGKAKNLNMGKFTLVNVCIFTQLSAEYLQQIIKSKITSF